MELSVVIPAYNEEKHIRSAIEAILAYGRTNRLNLEIIVVDDGSGDHTATIVKEFPTVRLIANEKNHGKGFSVRTGLLSANKENILFLDADLSTPITEFDKFIPVIKNYDCIIGSRQLNDSHIIKRQPFWREFLGRAGNVLIRRLTGIKVTDTQCGFKLINKSLQPIIAKMTINRWGFDVEMLYLFNKYRKSIGEVGVQWFNREESRVSPSDFIKTYKEILTIKKNDRAGKYQL
jgi:dolichyl-phosphate beta-glucosyltransferase